MLPCPPVRQRVTPSRLMGLALPGVAHCDLAARAEADFVRAFKSLPLDWTLLGPHIRYIQRGYLRKRLHRNRLWEMLLVCWLPGQHTVIHDHGDSWSATRVVCGEMSEVVYEWRGEGKKMRPLTERRVRAPELTIEKPGAIHKVWNGSPEPAVSLHLYSPPLVRLGSYDEKTGHKHLVIPDQAPDLAIGGKPLAD